MLYYASVRVIPDLIPQISGFNLYTVALPLIIIDPIPHNNLRGVVLIRTVGEMLLGEMNFLGRLASARVRPLTLSTALVICSLLEKRVSSHTCNHNPSIAILRGLVGHIIGLQVGFLVGWNHPEPPKTRLAYLENRLRICVFFHPNHKEQKTKHKS